MESHLPKWLESRHELLWEAFGDAPFTLDDAVKVLEKNKDKKQEVPVFISELRKTGWLKTELDKVDSRKRIYTLVSRKNIIESILSKEKNIIGRDEIERILKRAADLIRTRVDYKFILVLLFLKRVNDKWEVEFDKAYNEAIKDGLSEKDAKKEASSSAYHDFDLPQESRWESIRKEVEGLPEKFSRAMKVLSERNPDLRDVFENVNFLEFASNRENSEILRQLIELFSERRLHNVSSDILGDAYEWILRSFSPEKAKEGEVYTPREVIQLLVDILDPQPKESVYDPACASCGMLIISYKHVKEKSGKSNADKLFLFGQEANPHTLALGRMNLYIHDMTNAQLTSGDTLLRPKFKDEDDVKKFDVVLANPPWNQDGYDEEVLKKGEYWQKRFEFGFTPAQNADWAWIQHMLSSADPKTGRIGIVLDTGSLSRGGKEQSIRQQIIDNHYLECVILLPEKLFYNTSGAGIILILKRNKKPDKKNKILFINASEKFEKNPEIKKLNRLSKNGIKEIVDACNGLSEANSFWRVVGIDEIKNHNYDLTVTRYVDVSKKQKKIDVEKEWSDLQSIENEIEKIDTKLGGYLRDYGYAK